ncbi:MAG: FkbM family methyltransferase [Ardenticatenaceae bacterium]|nr:FkbM family methyltransferase [Ardenticatenaceae bacterium]
MTSVNWMTRIIEGEHYVNRAILESDPLPSPIKLLYGWLRIRLGREIYHSRFCPIRTSPTRIVASALRAGDVYLDIGANEGQMVSIASVATEPSGRVYAFEPREKAFQHLQLLCTAYRLANVDLFQFLVGDHDGERVLFESSGAPSSSSLSREWAGGVPRVYPMITLDTWARQNSVQRVDLIKIDVEGAEMQVLRGAMQLLRQTQPLVIMEIRGREVRRRILGYDVPDLMELLCSVGYEEFYSLRAAGLARIKRETEILPGDNDLLACCPRNTSDAGIAAVLARDACPL